MRLMATSCSCWSRCSTSGGAQEHTFLVCMRPRQAFCWVLCAVHAMVVGMRCATVCSSALDHAAPYRCTADVAWHVQLCMLESRFDLDLLMT